MATVYWIGSDGGGGGTDWNDTTNWSGGVPVNGDVVYIDRTSDSITTNLNQSAVTLNGLYITSNFTGSIGNDPDSGSNEFLQIAVNGANGPVVIGDGNGNGSQRLNLDFGTTDTHIDIRQTPTTGTDSPFAPLRIKMDNSGSEVQVNGDNSNVAFNDDPSLSSKDMGAVTIFAGSNITIGPGSVYTTLDVVNGNVLVEATQGTNVIAGGTVQLEGSATVTSITQTGGTVESNTTGIITTYTGRGGILDLQQSAFTRTITTLTKSPGFTVRYDDSVTITNDNLDTAYKQSTITVT